MTPDLFRLSPPSLPLLLGEPPAVAPLLRGGAESRPHAQLPRCARVLWHDIPAPAQLAAQHVEDKVTAASTLGNIKYSHRPVPSSGKLFALIIAQPTAAATPPSAAPSRHSMRAGPSVVEHRSVFGRLPRSHSLVAARRGLAAPPCPLSQPLRPWRGRSVRTGQPRAGVIHRPSAWQSEQLGSRPNTLPGPVWAVLFAGTPQQRRHGQHLAGDR